MNGCGYADIEDWSKEYLIERYKDLVEIEKEHKKENGELRERIKELEKKDKIIDKMAEQLEKCKNEIDCLTEGDKDCFIPEEFSNINDCVKYKTCKHCIKDYFTNLVEKENI